MIRWPAKGVSRAAVLQALSFAVSFACLLLMCRGLFSWLAHFVFSEPREDMAHGWFVPLFSIALLWLKRQDLAAARGKPSWIGLALALPGVFFFLVGTLGDQVRITQIGAIWLLWTLFYAVWGRRLAKVASFPVAFLLFTVPMSFLDGVTVKLRALIAIVATGLLNGAGIPVERVGTGLYCLSGEGFSLDIADPCSGLRSIFALSALTAAYAYLSQRTLRGKWLLFLCSVPVAMLGNLARIFSIALVARFCGGRVAMGFYHDYSGYVVFLVAVLAILWLGGLVSRLFDGPAKAAGAAVTDAMAATGSPDGPAAPRRLSVASAAPLALFPALLCATWCHILATPPPVQDPDDFIATRLAAIPGYAARYPFFCQEEQCGAVTEADSPDAGPARCPKCGGAVDSVSLAERSILPKDTRFLKCNYYDEATGDAWRVSVVVNGRSRQSIHRPEICLPAQGMSIENGHVTRFRLSGGEALALHCMDVRPRTSSSTSRLGHAYFFVSRRRRAADHLTRILVSVRDRAFLGRVTRWGMVTVSGEEPFDSSPARRAATEAFLSVFLPMLTDRAAESDAAGPEAEGKVPVK